MWERFLFGKRKSDGYFKVHWESKRAMRRLHPTKLDGEPIERLVLNKDGHEIAIALLKYGWRNWKLLNEREHWKEDDYFRFAERIMAEQKIKP